MLRPSGFLQIRCLFIEGFCEGVGAGFRGVLSRGVPEGWACSAGVLGFIVLRACVGSALGFWQVLRRSKKGRVQRRARGDEPRKPSTPLAPTYSPTPHVIRLLYLSDYSGIVEYNYKVVVAPIRHSIRA